MSDQTPLSDVVGDPVAGYWGLATKGAKATSPALVVRNGDVGKDGRIPVGALPVRYFTSKELTKAEVLREDAILVSSGAYTGNVGRVVGRSSGLPVIASNFVRRLRVGSEFDSGWLFHLLRSQQVQSHVWPHTAGSAIPNLGSSFYAGCPVGFVPPLSEQRRIAEVLDTVDETIRKTEEIIAKLEQVKQGLLHDLLTRGIDDNGELRDPDRHPEQFKDSPLGRIPKAWEVSLLGSRVEVKGGKRLPAGHAYADAATGYNYLRVTDFFRRRYSLTDLAHLYPKTFAALSRYEIRDGQLYISIAGSLGYSGVYRSAAGIRTILTENAARLVPTTEMVPEFVAHQINARGVQAQVEVEKGTGGGVPKLALFRIERLRLVWPSIEEQRAIVKRCAVLEARISREETALAKLGLVKQGLMEDLLTGRVRVTPLLEGADGDGVTT